MKNKFYKHLMKIMNIIVIVVYEIVDEIKNQRKKKDCG